MTRRGRRRPLRRALFWAALLAWTAFVVFPLYWTFQTSFKPGTEWITWPPLWWCRQCTLANYADVLRADVVNPVLGVQALSAVRPLAHSLVVSAVSSVLSVLLGSFLAYGISRYGSGGPRFPYAVLTIRMTPPIVVAVGFLVWFSFLHLLDTFTGLIILYVATTLPFVIWMMRAFIDEVPREMEYAARLMGATRLQVIRKIVFPLTASGLVVTLLFVYILNWSEFLLALTLMTPDVTTLTVQLSKYLSADEGRLYGPQAAFGLVATVPVVVLGVAIQKHLVKGFTFGMIRR